MFPAFVAETELPARPLLAALDVASDIADTARGRGHVFADVAHWAKHMGTDDEAYVSQRRRNKKTEHKKRRLGLADGHAYSKPGTETPAELQRETRFT